MTHVAFGFRCALALVFTIGGLAKLLRQDEFATAVVRYDLVSEHLARRVAGSLPPSELLIGLLLLVGLGVRAVSSLAALLLAVFTVAIASNLMRGREIDCGCAGIVAARRIGWSTVARNVALAAAAIVTAAVAPTALTLDSLIGGARADIGGSDAVATVFVSLSGTLALALAQEALSLVRLLRQHTGGAHA
ncbi:MAG TPA: MauE/DoxX family redox-associated membrane protein [Gaiellaceae bacterium]